jgi:hypothetical protein
MGLQSLLRRRRAQAALVHSQVSYLVFCAQYLDVGQELQTFRDKQLPSPSRLIATESHWKAVLPEELVRGFGHAKEGRGA